MRARLAAYAGSQLRDYFTGRAITTVLATAVAGWVYAGTRGLTLSIFDSAGGIDARAQLQRAFEFVLAAFAFVAAAMAAQGLVARHRSREYDRVVFSTALSPARYYLQGFIVAGLGAVVLAATAAELYAVAIHPVSVLGVAGYVALAWLTIGGLAFVLSTLTAFHVPILALAVAADLALAQYATGLRASARLSAFIGIVQYVLPPAHVVALLREPFARGVAVDPHVLVWPAAFGFGCVIVAFVLLRRRPFGS